MSNYPLNMCLRVRKLESLVSVIAIMPTFCDLMLFNRQPCFQSNPQPRTFMQPIPNMWFRKQKRERERKRGTHPHMFVSEFYKSSSMGIFGISLPYQSSETSMCCACLGLLVVFLCVMGVQRVGGFQFSYFSLLLLVFDLMYYIRSELFVFIVVSIVNSLCVSVFVLMFVVLFFMRLVRFREWTISLIRFFASCLVELLCQFLMLFHFCQSFFISCAYRCVGSSAGFLLVFVLLFLLLLLLSLLFLLILLVLFLLALFAFVFRQFLLPQRQQRGRLPPTAT